MIDAHAAQKGYATCSKSPGDRPKILEHFHLVFNFI